MLQNVKKYVDEWICINMFSEYEISLFYKKVEKSEEKIFRWGDYRPDLVLFRGCGGLFWKCRTKYVSLHYINERETPILTLFNIVGLYYKLKRCNSLTINTLHCILIPFFCINIHRGTQKIITYYLTKKLFTIFILV